MRGEAGSELWAKDGSGKNAAGLSSLPSHQCIALVLVGQKRLLESLGDVRVCSVALEVKDAELVE